MALRASPTSKAKQNKAVITKPRALTSAPSLDPKAQVAGTALPYKDTKTWAPNLQFHTTFRETCQQVPVLTTEPWAPGLEPIKAISSSSGSPWGFCQRSYPFGTLQHLLGCSGGLSPPHFYPFLFPRAHIVMGPCSSERGQQDR